MCEQKSIVGSYKERAVKWIESLDDLNVDGIEQIIFKFGMEASKVKQMPLVDQEKLKDLEETIQYLNGVLREIIGDCLDEIPVSHLPNNVVVEKAFVLDASPLASYSDHAMLRLNELDKKKIISQLKISGLVLNSISEIRSN